MKRKFNHKVILKYAGQALVIGTTSFILASCSSYSALNSAWSTNVIRNLRI